MGRWEAREAVLLVRADIADTGTLVWVPNNARIIFVHSLGISPEVPQVLEKGLHNRILCSSRVGSIGHRHGTSRNRTNGGVLPPTSSMPARWSPGRTR